MITLSGFKYEFHTVITEDDYLLGVHRIINPYIKDRRNLKPFLFIHGLMVNAACWVVNAEGWLDGNGVYYESNGEEPPIKVNCDPEVNDGNVQTQGFALAACGYDVWLLNTRGTKYSKRHRHLDVNGNLSN